MFWNMTWMLIELLHVYFLCQAPVHMQISCESWFKTEKGKLKAITTLQKYFNYFRILITYWVVLVKIEHELANRQAIHKYFYSVGVVLQFLRTWKTPYLGMTTMFISSSSIAEVISTILCTIICSLNFKVVMLLYFSWCGNLTLKCLSESHEI